MSRNSLDQIDDDQYEDEDNESEQENNTHSQRQISLRRKVILFDDTWITKSSKKDSKFSQSIDQGEATLLETEPDEGLLLDTDQHQIVSTFTCLQRLI